LLGKIFNKKNTDENKENSSEISTPKYEKPKILLIDLSDNVITSVRNAGFNAVAGSFGNPYKVKLSDAYHPVIYEFGLPENYIEQEVIIIDLTPPEILDNPKGQKLVSEGEPDWWAKCSYGVIDPRPRIMKNLQENFTRIFIEGGFFIIFAQPRLIQNLVKGRFMQLHGLRQFVSEPIYADNWSFLPFLSPQNLKIESLTGEEIFLRDSPITGNVFDGAKYTTIIKEFTYQDMTFEPIFWNKFDNCVGGVISYNNTKGKVIILPQIANKADGIVELLSKGLLIISPHLFPCNPTFKWIENKEYFLPNEKKLNIEKEEIKQKYDLEIAEKEREIQENHIKYDFLHDLLTETDKKLVSSIEKYFNWLGFNNVKNMDEINETKKEEDLQVEIDEDLLIIEIKGLGGTSRDSDCSQISKIRYRRMKERGNFDVFGLYIVNHQRHIPPLERKNPPFSPTQIEDADGEHGEIGLLTTWQLFNLYFAIEDGFITKENARKSLLKCGLIDFSPSNCIDLGRAKEIHHKGLVVIIDINNKIRTGNKIIIKNNRFSEANILEIQDNNKKVEEISSGEIGIKLDKEVKETDELFLKIN